MCYIDLNSRLTEKCDSPARSNPRAGPIFKAAGLDPELMLVECSSMKIRKLLMLPVVFSISAVLSFGAMAQQEDQKVNEKVRELQDQWNRIMKDEYNPAAIQPKTNGSPSFGSDRTWMKSSQKSSKKKSKLRSKSAKKKHGKSVASSRKSKSGKKVAKAGRTSAPKAESIAGTTKVKKTESLKKSKSKSTKKVKTSSKGSRKAQKSEIQKSSVKKPSKISSKKKINKK